MLEGWSIPTETLAAVGLAIGGLLFTSSFPLRSIWGKVSGLIPSLPSIVRKPVDDSSDLARSTDALPPVGFVDHARVIVQAAPKAPPEVLLKYLLDGHTEADALRAEVKRLGEGLQ